MTPDDLRLTYLNDDLRNDLRDHLRSLEELLLTPAVRHDPARLEQLLAPDFVEFGGSGRTFTRTQILAELTAEPVIVDLRLTDFTLHAVDPAPQPAWALVTYRSSRHDPTTAAVRTSLRSSTWVRRPLDGTPHWQLLFHQGTLLPAG